MLRRIVGTELRRKLKTPCIQLLYLRTKCLTNLMGIEFFVLTMGGSPSTTNGTNAVVRELGR